MDALVTAILKTVLSTPTPGMPAGELLTVDVFSPIEVLREGRDRVDSWFPKTSLTPDDRDAGYLFVVRPSNSLSPSTTADASGEQHQLLDGALRTWASAYPASPHRYTDPRSEKRATSQPTEQSAFVQTLDGGGAAEDKGSFASATTRRSTRSEEDTRMYGGSLPTGASSRTHAARSSASRVGQYEDEEEEEELLPQNRIDRQRRASFLIWVSAHFLSSRSPHLLTALSASSTSGGGAGGGVSAPPPSSVRHCVVPSATLGLWAAECHRAQNQDVLFCDALCIRPAEVVGVETDTLFVTARDRRIQALTVAVARRSGNVTTPPSTLAPTPQLSSAFAAYPETGSIANVGGATESDADEYCFAFHTGGLTRFVTSLRSLLTERIVRDMMLQQAASVHSIQVTQARAAVSGSRLATAVGRGVSPDSASGTSTAAVPNTDTTAMTTTEGRDTSLTSSARASRRHGTWRAVSKWANSSLQKMKESWQGAGGNPLQEAGANRGEAEESGDDIFDIPTTAMLSTRERSAGASQERPLDFDSAHFLVPILTIPSTSGLTAPTPSPPLPSSSAAGAAHHVLYPLSEESWRACFLPNGCLDLVAFERARRQIFYGGVAPCVREEIWLYLLDVYPVAADAATRRRITETNAALYAQCTQQWRSFTPDQLAHFQQLRTAIQAVEKDVARTDRQLEAYREEKSPKLQVLQRVLMAQVMLNFDLGYCQGMSDVLSPLTLLCESEDTVFSLFRHALARPMRVNFSMDPRTGMPARLRALQAVTRHFFPQLYEHLRANSSESMMFCFRWILMAYKREFPVTDLYKLWDVLFAAPDTADFDLVVAAGLLKGLGPQLLRLRGCDRIVMFANNLNGNVKVEDVIWYAHDFYNQMCVEHARLASLRAGTANSSVGVNAVSLHDMAALCLIFDGPLPAEEL